MSRISGIVGGTLISLLLAVTVYPSSATQELLQDLKEALRGLTELNKSAVQEAAHALGHATQQGEDRYIDHAPVSLFYPWESVVRIPCCNRHVTCDSTPVTGQVSYCVCCTHVCGLLKAVPRAAQCTAGWDQLLFGLNLVLWESM